MLDLAQRRDRVGAVRNGKAGKLLWFEKGVTVPMSFPDRATADRRSMNPRGTRVSEFRSRTSPASTASRARLTAPINPRLRGLVRTRITGGRSICARRRVMRSSRDASLMTIARRRVASSSGNRLSRQALVA